MAASARASATSLAEAGAGQFLRLHQALGGSEALRLWLQHGVTALLLLEDALAELQALALHAASMHSVLSRSSRLLRL